MDENDRQILEALGWTPEILESLKPTPATKSVDQMFLDHARKALAEVGCGALEFLAANRAASIVELAKRLNRGASAIGLTMAIYDEAARNGVVRGTAKDLLIRKIYQEFPKGWFIEDSIHTAVKIGSWDYDIKKYVLDASVARYAISIINHLTIAHPPPDGWKPQPENDPVIDELFDRYWPVGGSNSEKD